MKYIIVILLLFSVEAQAVSFRRCTTLFRERVARPGYSLSGKPLRMPPAIEIDFVGRASGHIRLQELIRQGQIYSHPVIANRVREILTNSFSDIQIGRNDNVFILDLQGDTGGQLFRSLTEGLINSAALDIIGIETASIEFSLNPTGRSASRLIIVIRDQIQDFRQLRRNQTQITNRSQALDWINTELTSLFKTLFEPTVFHAMDFPEVVKKSYPLLGKRPKVPDGHPRKWLTKQQFVRAYEIALSTMLQNISTSDLLYFRPSFWDDNPLPDRKAVQLFHYSNQRGSQSVDQFVTNFSANALRLRETLYRHIHRTSISGGRGHGTSSDYKPTEYFINRGMSTTRGDNTQELSGVSPQEVYGLDFLASRGSENIPISEAMQFASYDVQRIAQRLEQAGLSDMSQLYFLDASSLETQSPFLTINEIERLALELTQHKIFFTYPNSIYFRLSPDVRTIVRPPRTRNFEWNPRAQTYMLIQSELEDNN